MILSGEAHWSLVWTLGTPGGHSGHCRPIPTAQPSRLRNSSESARKQRGGQGERGQHPGTEAGQGLHLCAGLTGWEETEVGAGPPAFPNPSPAGTQPLRAVESSVPLRDISGQSCGLRVLGGGPVAPRVKQRGAAKLEQLGVGAGGPVTAVTWGGASWDFDEPATRSSYAYLILQPLAGPAITSGPL